MIVEWGVPINKLYLLWSLLPFHWDGDYRINCFVAHSLSQLIVKNGFYLLAYVEFNMNIHFHFSVWEKERMVSFGKRLTNGLNKRLQLRKYLMHFEMKLMHSEHFVKLCCCERSAIIQILFNCTAYIGEIWCAMCIMLH